jgi:lantibiotic modifying enzyme
MPLLDWLPDPIAERDIVHATTFTERAAMLPIDSLCCGNLGRAELLWTAGQRLAVPAFRAAARRILDEVLARADRRGHFALQSNGFCFPGFHQGLSGIGYQLLRFHDPVVIPSLLAWQ